MKKVDVVILNCNSNGILEKCIINLKKTDYPIRILVVDNGSQDGSTDFIKNHPDVTLIKNYRNLGCPAGLNKAYPYLKGDFVAYLNEDVFPYPDWLDNIIPLFEKDAQLGAIGMKLVRPDGSIEADGTYIDPITCSAGGLEQQFSMPVIVPYIGLGNIVVRKKVFNKVGLFEEIYFLYWDDVEFCIRLWRAGYKILHVPRAKALHLHRWSTRRNISKVKTEHYPIRNGILTILAYLSKQEIKIYLPSIFLLKAINIILLLIHRNKVHSTANLIAYIGVLRRLNWIIKKRIKSKHNKMLLTQISKMSPSNPSFFKKETNLVKELRKNALKSLHIELKNDKGK